MEMEYKCPLCIYKGTPDISLYYDRELMKQYESNLAALPGKIEDWKVKCEEQKNLYKSFKAECIAHNNALSWPKFLRRKWVIRIDNSGRSSETINIISGTRIIKSEDSNSFIVNREPSCIKPRTRYVKCPLCEYKQYIPNTD
jgi:hypothetical protein